MNIAIEILNAALEMFVAIFFFGQMLEKRETTNFFRYILIVCILGAHISRSFFPLSTYTNIGITCVLWWLLITILYDDLFFKKAITFMLYFVAVLMADILCRFTLSCMINSIYVPHSAAPGLERYIGMILINILIFSILSLIANASKHKKFDIPLKYQIILIMFPVFSLFISVFIDGFILLSGTDNVKYIFALLFIIVGLIYFNMTTFEFMDTYSAKVRLAATEELVKNQAESYKLLEINEKELRKLKHNINEHMQVIKEMIAYDACKDSVDLADSIKRLSCVQTSLVYTGDIAIDAILNVEAKKAAESNIKYLVKMQNFTVPVKIAAIDKSTILCNTINNAIESCQKIHDRERFVVIDISSTCNKVRICIENSSLPLNIRNNHIYSTKKDIVNHGLGIECVKNSLDKYNGSFCMSFSNGVTSCSIKFDNIEEKINA